MNADDVIRGLRCEAGCGEECPYYTWGPANADDDYMHEGCEDARLRKDAADLIESQQAEIASLRAELAESQRREQAALSDLTELGTDGPDACEYCRKFPCDDGTHSMECTGFEWRGPQQAGEGANFDAPISDEKSANVRPDGAGEEQHD